MKDRIISLVGALIALYILIVLMVPPTKLDESKISLPTSIDDGVHGYLGLKRWLIHGGVSTKVLRRRYTFLSDTAPDSLQGNLLVITLPHTLAARDKEIRDLKNWLEIGNHALILIAQSHEPGWIQGLGKYKANNLIRKLGFSLLWKSPADNKDTQDSSDTGSADKMSPVPKKKGPTTEDILLSPVSSHPVLYGVRNVYAPAVTEKDERTQLKLDGRHRSSMKLLENPRTGNPYFWLARLGRGRIWIAQHGDLFGNVSLGKKDNARLLDNILDLSLSKRGAVIFDDMHHGNSALYDPEAFFSDSRLHNTLWFVFAFWLIYVVGYNNRLAPLRQNPVVYRNIDFVDAVGNLIARNIDKDHSMDLMFTHFFNSVRQQYRLPTNGAPVWNLIDKVAGVNSRDLKLLKESYNTRFSKKSKDLVKIHNLLLRVRSALI